MNRTMGSLPNIFSAPIFLGMVACCLLFSAAMAGETGPWAIAAAGGVHAAGIVPAVAAPKAGPWEPVQLDLKAEATAQYQALVVQIANRAWFERDHVAARVADRQALILNGDRDPLDVVLRRTRALLADVKASGPRYDLSAAEAALGAAEARAQGLPAGKIAPVSPADMMLPYSGRAVWAPVTPPLPAGPRYELFLEVCAIRRQIALANPLLDFDQLVFIKRIRQPHMGHMCTYPGGDDKGPKDAGGGIFVLRDPFGSRPKLRSILADAANRPNQPQGLNLARPTICSFDLSYDARTILFAGCVPPSAEPVPPWFRFGRDGWIGHWSLFRVNVDGSGFTRMTDSPFNDFDPCFLPDGRVAFMSERRGGLGRCHGQAFPTYTLHSMNADGGDITCLSFHETNEWNPSVDLDGKIIYTRWDYVDREPDIAHHMWTCLPDGRDPRSFHGNYPVAKGRREMPGQSRFGSRPFGEWNCRAIPGRPGIYIATASGHHGPVTWGSLVLIDTNREDDGDQSQIRRVTPEAPFPEAEQDVPKNRDYGWAWPLSERFFLCAYDSEFSGREELDFDIFRGGKTDTTKFFELCGRVKVNYGICLVDVYGNKELIYRDPAMSSFCVMPLRARARPPVIPSQTAAAAKSSAGPAATRPATVAVMNVYESDFAWPAGTSIKALRLVQVLPKTTPRANQPRIGMGSQNSARAVLGTVPVESDGSAYFEAPTGKQFYLQALDERGLAVQSMRSGTYLQPGEQMTCLGCHERKGAGQAPRQTSVALRRPPSKIATDADGSNPFSYVRLVQPVLDRHCVACHAQKKAIDLSGAQPQQSPDPKRRSMEAFTQSYVNLAPKYGFWFDSVIGCSTGPRGGSRTAAGKFGASASPLLSLLDKGHHGVKLPPEDLHRLTLWLDCNSDFLGAYHNVEAQLRGEIVRPDLE
jgi:hypothetical protein